MGTFKRLLKHRMAVVGMIIVLAFLVIAAFAPSFLPVIR